MVFAIRYKPWLLKEVSSSYNTTDVPRAVYSASYLSIYPIVLVHFYKVMFEYDWFAGFLNVTLWGVSPLFKFAVEKSLMWAVSKAKDGANYRLVIAENRRLSLPNLAKWTWGNWVCVLQDISSNDFIRQWMPLSFIFYNSFEGTVFCKIF